VSDRLEEFRRQRALQREHLDWIDREIAALEGSASAPEPPRLPILAPRPPIPEIGPSASLDAEAILEEYRKPAVSIAKQTRTGCMIYMGAALALLALAVVAVYLYARALHGH
jgi:hypothetical protein